MRVGCIGTERVPPEEEEGGESEGEEGGPGPLRLYCFFPSAFLCSSFLWYEISGCGFFFLCPSLVFLSGGWGPYYDRLGRSVAREMVIYKSPPLPLRQQRSCCHGLSARVQQDNI